jgi:N-acetylgalactosamine-N,N'-diacetylbacillosaminyl-diphospho-undecaprenol 4-alpha-N-acetylgalactosaminyltransferase
MASGIPCIATNIGGNRDLLNPDIDCVGITQGEYFIGTNGILVNVDDSVGLTKAIEALAIDQNLRERLATEARRWVLDNCSLERVTDRYLSLYYELLHED